MALPGGKQREIDRGYKELKRRWMGHTNGIAVAVGVMGKTGARKPESDGPGPEGENIFDEAITNLLIAAVAEFGTVDGAVPPRSWLRAFVDENRNKIRKKIRVLERQVLDGKLDHERALGLLGAKLVGQIQTRISKGIAPPLAESTKARRAGPDKGHKGPRKFTPLIDTGQFWQSITWEIRKRGAA